MSNVAEATARPEARAILFREAYRASRQPRVYIVRTAFSAFLIAVILAITGFASMATSLWDPGTLGSMGRTVFIGFAVVEILAAMILAPLLVARSVIEEREEGTIDLLVLTQLTGQQIFISKVVSSLLVLAMIVLGATPVLAIVTSLGGVSVFEVASVTVSTLAAMVVLGTMGGFFALFTRSQLVSTVLTLLWSIPIFLVVPWLYAFFIASADGATHLSPLYATAARGWGGVLPALIYLPLVLRMLFLGGRIFEQRASRVSLQRLFRGEVWRTTPWLIYLGSSLALAIVIAPMVSVFLWSGPPAIAVTLGTGFLFVVAAMLIDSLSWIYLRIGGEWSFAIEAMFMPKAKPGRRNSSIYTGNSPIVWRELRIRRFGAWLLLLGIWGVVLLIAFQSMLWLIPGGIYAIGVANAAVGIGGAAWLAVRGIENERHEGTLELLRVSLLPNHQIVLGKLLAALIPTSPLILLAACLFFAGVPHAALVNNFQPQDVLRGLTLAFWTVSFWLAVAIGAQALAIRLRRAKAAYGISLAIVGSLLFFPWVASVLFAPIPWFAATFRWFAPIIAVRAPWYEPMGSTLFLLLLSLVGIGVTATRLRTWSAEVDRSGGS